MVVRYNKDDGSHAYEQIDFRETMPAAGNETVSFCVWRKDGGALRRTLP